MKSQYQGGSGQISLYFGNKHTEALTRLVCNVPPTPAFLFQLGAVPTVIEAKKQVCLPGPSSHSRGSRVQRLRGCPGLRVGLGWAKWVCW